MTGKTLRRAVVLSLALMMTFTALMLAGCGKSYEYIFGNVEWRSTYNGSSSDAEGKTIKDSFYYSDDWFKDDPSSENRELALVSMQLVASCVSDEEDNTGAAFLKSMGFEETGYSDFRSNDPDDCNYIWARKNAGDSTLVAVVIQSVNTDNKLRNKAWKQNFTVNDPESEELSGEHYAYAKAADKAAEDIASLEGDGDTVFWITGQSRGGAIADILAVRLSEKTDDSKIFAYTFEAPATVDAGMAGNYKFIHNYVCSDDIVTHIPVWGMTRYGVTHDLKTNETDEGLDESLTALGSEAAGMKPRIVTNDAVARLTENIEAAIPSRSEYSAVRTDSWTDSEGKNHELTYTCQEALTKLVDLLFGENTSGSLLEGLAARKSELGDSIGYMTEGVRNESAGKNPAPEYWEAAEDLYAVLNEEYVGSLPVSEEDMYKIVRMAAPILISIPQDGGEPDTELLTDVIVYNRELAYSHQFDTIIARLKVLAPAPDSA